MTAPVFTSRILDIEAIRADDRLRPIDPAIVEMLAASMHESGLQQPIVTRPDPDGNGAILIAGAHRLAAARQLGWQEIAAVMFNADAAQARMKEIDENLVRHELSPLDRAIFLKERKKIHEAIYPETAHGKAPKSRKEREKRKVANLATFSRFSIEAANKTGLSERSIRRATELVDKLDPEALALVRQSAVAGNAAQLKQLASMEPERQRLVARAIAEKGIKTVQAARIAAGLQTPSERDPQEIAYSKIFKLLGTLGVKRLDQVLADVKAEIATRRRVKAG